MEITKFRVKHYRSIIDSGDCYFSPKITVLAGQNEAGKTSILQALADFSKDEQIRQEAFPIDRDGQPEITVTFKLPSEQLKQIFRKAGINIEIAGSKNIDIRKTPEKNYQIVHFKETFPEITKKVKGFERKVWNDIESISEYINNNNEIGTFNLKDKGDISRAIESIRTYIENTTHSHESDPDKTELTDETSKRLQDYLDKLDKYKEANHNVLNFKETLKNEILTDLPGFILFHTYKDRIPNEVPIEDLDESNFIQDLAEISDLDPKLIGSGTAMAKQRHKREVNIQINEDYRKFWNQDAANLYVDWDSDTLYFWVMENDQPYPPSLRSEGRRWHLSFYIKLSAHASEKHPPVILVDDPGLYLHAKAQKDILNKFEDVAETSKIIYSTHSPYLIDTKQLNRVWLVRKKDRQGTKVEKLHAGADKDTLRPVLTAIGADTTLGLQLDKENQVVVEGISDYHYLQAFSNISDWDGEIDIIPGTGGNTPVYIGSILFGWGVDPIFCLDPDDPHKNARKIREELGIEEEKIIFVTEGEGAIEDVLAYEDFKDYVLEDQTIEYESKNSTYVNKEDMDKVLLAKKFFEKTYSDGEMIDLHDKTIESIEGLFDKINSIIN